MSYSRTTLRLLREAKEQAHRHIEEAQRDLAEIPDLSREDADAYRDRIDTYATAAAELEQIIRRPPTV